MVCFYLFFLPLAARGAGYLKLVFYGKLFDFNKMFYCRFFFVLLVAGQQHLNFNLKQQGIVYHFLQLLGDRTTETNTQPHPVTKTTFVVTSINDHATLLLQGLPTELHKHIDVYHSQIPDRRQQEISKDLMDPNGSLLVVIATSALSMGFDAVGMYENFVNQDIPSNPFIKIQIKKE
jgi:hypothetical protein